MIWRNFSTMLWSQKDNNEKWDNEYENMIWQTLSACYWLYHPWKHTEPLYEYPWEKSLWFQYQSKVLLLLYRHNDSSNPYISLFILDRESSSQSFNPLSYIKMTFCMLSSPNCPFSFTSWCDYFFPHTSHMSESRPKFSL